MINLPFDDVLVRMAAEHSAILRRAVVAEAQVGVLQQQVALQRQMIESMIASRQNGGPTTTEPAERDLA